MFRKYSFPTTLTILLLGLSSTTEINLAHATERGMQSATDDKQISPSRQIKRRPGHRSARSLDQGIRSIDGSGNNISEPTIGAAHENLRRLVGSDYADDLSAPAGENRPSARLISNAVAVQSESITNLQNASDFLWQWGQFIDHDIDLTDGIDPPESFPIQVPVGDPWFDPANTGTVEIALNRSIFDPATGVGPATPREQINEITAWIDGSNVYGSDEERALELRLLDGTGRLKTSDGNLLPFNDKGLPNAGGSDPAFFLAGDVRANEQVGLAAMHTLFVREHNRMVGELTDANPSLSGNELFERARNRVVALMQVITYNEFLPLLLGSTALAEYSGYDEGAARGISNIFSTASYRFGHSALSETLLRIDAAGNEIPAGNPDQEIQDRLAAAYDNTRQIDAWVGGLAEQPLPGAMVGEFIATVLIEQFTALRDGDRFWYERSLPANIVSEVESTSLADVIRRNTDIGAELSDDVFRVATVRVRNPNRNRDGQRQDNRRSR